MSNHMMILNELITIIANFLFLYLLVLKIYHILFNRYSLKLKLFTNNYKRSYRYKPILFQSLVFSILFLIIYTHHTCNLYLNSKLTKNIPSIIIVLLLTLIPMFKHATIIMLMCGIFDDISISSCLFLLLIFVKAMVVNDDNSQRINQLVIINKYGIIIIAMLMGVLYLSTLNFIDFDLYSYGYQENFNWQLGLIYVILQLFVWHLNKILALIWLMALLVFVIHGQHSTNLWDYLFDPLLPIIYLFNFDNDRINNDNIKPNSKR